MFNQKVKIKRQSTMMLEMFETMQSDTPMTLMMRVIDFKKNKIESERLRMKVFLHGKR
jgi:hypothetical protein